MFYGTWSHSCVLSFLKESEVYHHVHSSLEDGITFPKINGSVVSCESSGFYQYSHDSLGSAHQPPFCSLTIADSSSACVTYSLEHSCWQWTGRAFTRWHTSDINDWHCQTLIQPQEWEPNRLDLHLTRCTVFWIIVMQLKKKCIDCLEYWKCSSQIPQTRKWRVPKLLVFCNQTKVVCFQSFS